MKQNTKFILSSTTLLLFALLAGGSYDDIGIIIWVIIGVFTLALIQSIIQSAVDSHKKSKRLEILKKEEALIDDFDCSVCFGDDQCRFYFDSVKRQAMIIRVVAPESRKVLIDNFEITTRELFCQRFPNFVAYDEKNRQLLYGNYKDIDVTYEVLDISKKDHNIATIPNNSIPVRLKESDYYDILTLIDECHGLIAILRNGKVESIFNYVDSDQLSQKKGDKAYIKTSQIGRYMFVMDDFFNVLLIITPFSHELINYSDIIEVSYEENGCQVFHKSAMRTVGGAIVGNALMGGAGTVVGGLSGSTKQNMEISTMDVKILKRSIENSTIILHFNGSGKTLKTNNSTDKSLYQGYRESAIKAKDLLSVIIDKVKQDPLELSSQEVLTSTSQLSVADELTKLAKLKSDGILSEEEFKVQKEKLLNS